MKTTTNTNTNKGEKIGEIIGTILTIGICATFLTGIAFFVYNFVTTIISGGSFNI